VFVPQGQLYALIIALVALSGTWLFLQRTMLGRAIRGTADNRDARAVRRDRRPRIDALTFGIGAALADSQVQLSRCSSRSRRRSATST